MSFYQVKYSEPIDKTNAYINRTYLICERLHRTNILKENASKQTKQNKLINKNIKITLSQILMTVYKQVNYNFLKYKNLKF